MNGEPTGLDQDVEEKVEKLLSEMSLEEKIGQLRANRGNFRLKKISILALLMLDNPL